MYSLHRKGVVIDHSRCRADIVVRYSINHLHLLDRQLPQKPIITLVCIYGRDPAMPVVASVHVSASDPASTLNLNLHPVLTSRRETCVWRIKTSLADSRSFLESALRYGVRYYVSIDLLVGDHLSMTPVHHIRVPSSSSRWRHLSVCGGKASRLVSAARVQLVHMHTTKG